MEQSAPDEVERLVSDLKDDRRDIRSRAAYELGKHNDSRIIAPLTAALSDNDKFVRSWAAGSLGKAGARAVEPLVQVLEGSDTSVGYYAALALGDLGDLRAVPLLAAAVREGDWDIRSSAAETLERMGDAQSLPCCIVSESSLSAVQRLEILAALRDLTYSGDGVHIHYTFPDAAELCTELLHTGDDSVRKGASELLQSLAAMPGTKVDGAEQREPAGTAASLSKAVEADGTERQGPAGTTTSSSKSVEPDGIEPQAPLRTAAPAPKTASAPPQEPEAHRDDASAAGGESSKPKRSLWDRLVGRHHTG